MTEENTNADTTVSDSTESTDKLPISGHFTWELRDEATGELKDSGETDNLS